jgi:class 3 adenylate cyclase/tetratricopeptide (TPR) repeat protein
MPRRLFTSKAGSYTPDMPACPKCGTDNPEASRFCSACGCQLSHAPDRDLMIRKVVTILFADLANSTTLAERHDPEPLRHVIGRYFDEMQRVLERHGGTVEKFVGDAVMSVFGHPIAHEDDAVRAVRAAVEMRVALSRLNEALERQFAVRLEMRIGINTGEVVAGDPAFGHAFVTGDTVNTAKRLEEAAQHGQTFLGEATLRLVRDAVRAEPIEPFTLKGKEVPVRAFRLLDVRMEAPGILRRLDAPIVGRERELERLRALFDGAVADTCCSLVLLLGPAGIGKSRLAKEFVASLGEHVLVLRGRCLSYRQGTTFGPVVEIVRQAAELSETDSDERAREKVVELFTDRNEGEEIYERLVGVLGFGGPDVVAQEIFWAVRRLLEALAATRPVVALLDDIHWAEPTFLDLLEYLAGWSTGFPILLCCLARPDLLEQRRSHAAAGGAATQIRLEPLVDEEAREFIAELLGAADIADEVHSYVAESAEGNPLFLEELVRMLVDEGHLRQRNGNWSMPDGLQAVRLPLTIQALLTARLDTLGPDERIVIERAAIVGPVFWWSAVAELAPLDVRPRLAAHLQALVRRDFLSHAESGVAGEDAFAFSHGLVRDAAYAGLPKEVRAELHEQHAAWLELRAARSAGEYEELVGYQLEQAVRYRRELARVDERTEQLARTAGTVLRVAGTRALGRGDAPAAADLLERSASLLGPGPDRSLALLELTLALRDVGELARAEAVVEEAKELAAAGGHARLEARAELERAVLQIYTSPGDNSDEMLRLVDRVMPVLEHAADHEGLAKAWYLVGAVHWVRCQAVSMEEVLERALVHARRAGSQRELAFVLNGLARAVLVGPTPVNDALGRCTVILQEAAGDRTQEALLSIWVAILKAMRGEFESARDLCAASRATLEELGQKLRAVALQGYIATIEQLAGDLLAAERLFRSALETLQPLGEQPNVRLITARLANVLVQLDRIDEAERLAQLCRETAPPDDVGAHVRWRIALASVLGRRAEYAGAERLAAEAVVIADQTDWPDLKGDAQMCLAAMLTAGGKDEESRVAASAAARCYEAKGNLVSARRAKIAAGLTTAVAAADRAS